MLYEVITLELRRRDVDVVVLGSHTVSDAGEHVGDGICDCHGYSLSAPVVVCVAASPAGLGHAGDLALARQVAEADAAHAVAAKVGAAAAAQLAAVVRAHLELRFRNNFV